MHLALMQTQMPDITILNGTTDSPAIDWATLYFDAESLSLIAPAILPETVTFQTSIDGGVTWNNIQDLTATNVKGPTAGGCIVYNGTFSGLLLLRLHAGGAVAADRVFKNIKSWRGSL